MPKCRNLYLLVGPSGAGKTTIANLICKQCGLTQVESYTTRPRRTPDEGGHRFLSAEKYPDWHTIERQFHDIVARTIYNGHFYFATREQMDTADLYVIDPPGVDVLRKHCHKRGLRVIYILSPTEALRRRMVARGSTEAEADERIALDTTWFAECQSQVDYVAYNVDLGVCVWDIYDYIMREERL